MLSKVAPALVGSGHSVDVWQWYSLELGYEIPPSSSITEGDQAQVARESSMMELDPALRYNLIQHTGSREPYIALTRSRKHLHR